VVDDVLEDDDPTRLGDHLLDQEWWWAVQSR